MKFAQKLKEMLKKRIYGPKYDSKSYIHHLRSTGVRIGEGTVIYNPRSVLIDATRPWLIDIGKYVKITHGVVILTHGYDWSVLQGVYGEVLGSSGKVTIGDNVFIGVNSVILKGVTIGSNVIIGAGSLVNKDIPDNCVAAGNPAKVLMTLEEYHEKRVQAQKCEAEELVREYRIVYGKEPDEAALDEFFWLFNDGFTDLHDSWNYKMNLHGNRDYCDQIMREHKKQYEDFKDFLDQC